MARRYVDALQLVDWAHVVLERLGLPPAKHQPAHMDELCTILRRVVEEQAVEHFTIAELAALARFYATREGASVIRKMAAFQTAATPTLTAEIVSWARTVAARVRPQPSTEEVTP